MGLGMPSRADLPHQYGPLDSKLLRVGRSQYQYSVAGGYGNDLQGSLPVPIPLS